MKSEENEQKLEDVRELIDSVDHELIMLLKQRSRLVEMVTDIKKESGDVAHQPTRFAIMVDQLQAVAKEEGLDPELVTEVWDAIHESSKRQQNAVLKKD
ncbi:MAG TPA: chorismate mutase [Candidatus Saccharibacteria bacterium]|mgnify:FL=1|jgi:chorismate mutase|nr:chorismate mutase [Candidatus Saccharibacteria bacterium]